MHVIMQPQGLFYGDMLDSTLWSPILANLTKLSIVAQQPLQVRTYFTAPSSEHQMEEWTEMALCDPTMYCPLIAEFLYRRGGRS